MSSLGAWLQAVCGVVVFFAVSVLFDMVFKYRFQLVYSASHTGSESWRPSLLTGPAVRHVVLLLLACVGVYIYRMRINNPSASVIVWFALLVVYGVLLFRDSVRDLKRRA